jgi:hypothetical protein
MKTIWKPVTLVLAISLWAIGAPSVSAADMNTTGDEVQIQHLFAQYVFALDTLDPDAYSSLFTKDAVITMGPQTFDGHDKIYGLIANYRKQVDFSKIKADTHGRKFGTVRHVNTAFLINVHGNSATSESYWMEVKSNADMNGVGNPPTIINMGRYEDELEKQNGKWLFSRRSIIGDMYDPTQGKAPAGD